MKASIEGEDEDGCGLEVIDNEGVEHWIEIKYGPGDITYHEQDGYPDDPSKRTPEESEHVHQARRFARYHVKLQRGYDTMPPLVDPDRIETVRAAVVALSPEGFDELFGDLHQQLASYYDEDVERVLDIPAEAASPESVLYRKNVYLGVDPLETDLAEEAEELADEYGLDFTGESVATRSLTELDGEEVAAWEAFSEDLADRARETGTDVSAGTYIDAVSPLHMAYIDDAGREHVQEVEEPFERDPDAMIELGVIDPGPPAEFQAYLAFHLRCQVRDAFVRMGLEPPEAYRVLGYGNFEATERYKHLDMYPEYHDPEADLAGWGIEMAGEDSSDDEDDDGLLGIF